MEELMDGRMQINGFLKHLGGRPVFNSEKGLLKEGKKKRGRTPFLDPSKRLVDPLFRH